MSTNESSSPHAPAEVPRGGRLRADRGRRRRSSSVVRILTEAGQLACVAAIGLAPVLAGGVHRWTMLALMLLGSAGLTAMAIGLAAQGRPLRTGTVAFAPAVLVLIPLLQIVPLPLWLRHLFDRTGSALIEASQLVPTSTWPLSLDPQSTRTEVGRAALGLIAFLCAYHLASGKRRRHLVLRVIGGAGIACVVIGLGHRILGIPKLYGILQASPRSLLIGPFVNANHTAEVLELSTFVCLACAFQRPTALNRVGWLVGAALCGAATTATLSRGGVVGLAAGAVVFVLLRYAFATREGGPTPRGRSLLWIAGGSLILLVLASALGADQLLERFKSDTVTANIRLGLWRDSLRVLAAHPMGIGRGTFDRVFPIYRTLKTSFPLRFAFVENEPLQLLIDCGWFFFVFVAAAAALVGVVVARRGRRDPIEAALLAGIVAIVIHNGVDFGLETLGVLLPFAAVVGTVLGRAWPTPEEEGRTSRSGRAVLILAASGAAFGVIALAHRSSDNFDAALRKPMSVVQRRALLLRAETIHPLDYFYALDDARLRPIKGPPGSPSPRLHALNRALRLCPSCEAVHVEVARNLWAFRLRRQSLLEWRTAVDLQPSLFDAVIGELASAGAKPEELAAVASSQPAHLLDLVYFLADRNRVQDAFTVLNQADEMGAPPASSLVARATLQVRAGQREAAQSTLSLARQNNIRDPRLAVLEARVLLAAKGAAGADEALGLLDTAAARYPMDLPIQRERLDVVVQFERWKAASRAIEGLKSALYHAHGSAGEAQVAAARIQGRLGHWTAAMDEYRVALADEPSNAALWIEYGHAAEQAGQDATARDAYAEAGRIAPNAADVAALLRNLESRQARLRALLEDSGSVRGAKN